VLPLVEEVRREDRIQYGVALKSNAMGLWVYPYLFRLVCWNGAIVAQLLQSRSLDELHFLKSERALYAIREAIQACCAPEIFMDTMRGVRASAFEEIDFAEWLSFVSGHVRLVRNSERHASEIFGRFEGDEEPTRYGLANAVTSVARDTRNPHLRWDLEELGGAILVGTVPRLPVGGERRILRSRELEQVG
jgi:hypothetical protein